MDSVFEKAGVYDLFGVFLTGAIVCTISDFLNIFDFNVQNTNPNALSFLQFILISYLLGLVLQEVSSFFDRNFFHTREKVKADFLNSNNSVVKNPLELDKYREFSFKILNKTVSDCNFTPDECISVFYYCKSYLEVTQKNGKESKIDSLYAMSRSLSLAFFIMGGYLLFIPKSGLGAAVLILSYIFYFRANRYAAYRVRIVMRQYYLAELLQQSPCP